MKRLYIALLVLMTAFPLWSGEVESLSLHLKLSSMDRPEAPFVSEGFLILSAQGPHRFIGAAFEHEDYTVIHPFQKNKKGVFILVYPLPLAVTAPLAYRLVVDGVWMRDPWNPQKLADRSSGLELSLAEVPYLSREKAGLYRLLSEDGRIARFLWKGRPGEIVSVAGSFNNWDPFIHELEETEPGVYRLELRLPPGVHYYCFVYRGEASPDPLNLEKATSPEGKIVSVLRVSYR